MFDIAVTFTDLLLAALTAGAMVGVWLGMNPAGLAPGVYVAQQQHLVTRMNVRMPLLGGATALCTIVAAALAHADPARRGLLAASAVCFVAAGLVTRLSNQPINATVMTWAPEAMPADWTRLRDRWWRWHTARTGLGLVGLCLVVAAVLVDPHRG